MPPLMKQLCAALALLPVGLAACGGEPPSVVRAANGYRLTVTDNVLSSAPARQLLGVHSLWWGHAEGLFAEDGRQTRAEVRDWLAATGGVLRYGGAVNEISWRACAGPQKERLPVKAVPWGGPMRCRFGSPEYLDLLRDAGLSTTWFLPNLAGIDYQLGDIDWLAAEAAEQAGLIADQAPLASRFWELGNELERGRYQWSPEQLGQRATAVGQAILERDRQAQLVLPLIEFDHPAQPPRRKFNERLLKATSLQLAGFAMHQYYDGAPGGPSISTQLSTLRDTASQIARTPGAPAVIWITEHGRWPEGDGSNPDWRQQWYRTNDMDGVLGTADYLVGLSQIAQVSGAMLHGLRAGPWNQFDIVAGVPRPTGTAQLLEMLGSSGAEQRLATYSFSRNDSGYAGGYELRGAAFRDAGRQQLVVWVVNRAEHAVGMDLNLQGATGSLGLGHGQALQCLRTDAPCQGADFERTPLADVLPEAPARSVRLKLPPRSVVVYRFEAGQ
jgi:hypothetical protein